MSTGSVSSASPLLSPKGWEKERWILMGVMLLGLVHGGIFVFVMPPWQHYEEPTHFEYAWLIASRLTLPQYPAYDQAKRREIARSMIEHGFFKGLGFLPDLDAPEEQPIWIGVNVTGALPLYHILVALPLRFALNADVETQLYLARLVSLALYLSTLWLAYQVLCEFVPLGHPLRWLVPGTMALLPGFTDLMTAVNNDVGATFVFSLYSLAAVRLILHGLSLRRGVELVVTTGLCLVTKNTVLVAFPLMLLAVVFALHRYRWWIASWALFLVAALIAIGAVFSWGDASLWYRDSMQETPTQVERSEAPLGNYAIALEIPLGKVRQPLLSDRVQELKGKTVTVGAWMWASEPTLAYLPILSDNHQMLVKQVYVDVRPTFHASQAKIAQDASRVWVVLQAVPTQGFKKPVTLFYDGIILLEGEWPSDTPPVFDDPYGEQGTWGNRRFRNVIRNASAEWAWPFVRPWVEMFSRQFPWAAHLSPRGFVNPLLDLQHSHRIYQATISRLFKTFWGYFGWGHISLPWVCYQVLKGVTVLSLLGAPLGLWNISQGTTRSGKLALVWLGVAMLTIWAIVFIRGLPSLFDRIYIPTARYAYPAIIPTMLLLSLGWCAGLPRQRWLTFCAYLYGSGFVVLDLISIVTIINFYAGG